MPILQSRSIFLFPTNSLHGPHLKGGKLSITNKEKQDFRSYAIAFWVIKTTNCKYHQYLMMSTQGTVSVCDSLVYSTTVT